MNGGRDFSLEHVSFNFGMPVRYPHWEIKWSVGYKSLGNSRGKIW